MEYIDKQIGKASAHAVLNDFLERYHESGLPFPEDMYDALKNDRNNGVNTFQQYSESMLKENGYRCCYCMRTLRQHPKSHRYPVTLDHVILNSIDTQEEYDAYFEMESELEKNDMVLGSTFVKTQQWPPYPHRIAYENLVPSCFGYFPNTGSQSMTCNVKRGNSFVHPLLFRKAINDEIKYYNDGTVEWTSDPKDDKDGIPYVNRLGLNYKDLQIIRCMWYFLSNEGLTCDIANREKIFMVIDADIDDEDDEDRRLWENLKLFKKDEYWQMLDDFQYFNNRNRFTERQK